MMNKIQDGKKVLFCIIGKSAAGKDTILKELYHLCNKSSSLNILIHDTTRPKRQTDSYNFPAYYFVSELEYWDNIDMNQYLVHHEFRGWGYGLKKGQIIEDKYNIGIFNPCEIDYLIKNYANEFDIQIVYINCPLKERISRIKSRGTNIFECCRRLISDWKDFRYCLKRYKYQEIDNYYQSSYWGAYRLLCLVYEFGQKNNI